ncbi:MAG: hypothetical protein ABJA61_01295 [Caldimonas sp.]
MWKTFSGLLAAALASSACLAADLTETESRWLKGAWPVIAFARQAKLPLDIVVQPQPTPGAAPLGMAFVDGRCKLVLSMRGNPEAQATLERIEPELLDATLELMAAHELGHCRRYLDTAWYALPAGFAAVPVSVDAGAESPPLDSDMAAARREEGFGDLVGLAWTQQHHPRLYTSLHAWLLDERTKDRVVGGAHDTLPWLRLAQEGATLAGTSIFAKPSILWAAGLAAGEGGDRR